MLEDVGESGGKEENLEGIVEDVELAEVEVTGGG